MFSLTAANAKLENVNPRAELHGEDHALAADLKISVTLSNDILSEFDSALKAALFWKGESGQGELIEEPGHLPCLRFPEMGPIRWSKELTGYTMTVHVGVFAASNIILGDCSIDKFVFEPQEGGSVVVSFRIQAHPDSMTLGSLCERIQQDVEMSLTPPEACGGEYAAAEEQGEIEEAA